MYRKVDVMLWGDAKFQALSTAPPNAQTLWLRLLTGPELTMLPGLICAGRLGLAEALGWSPEGFDKAFEEVSTKGMAKADWKARVILAPKACFHNPPESPNVVRGWRKHFDLVPQCALKRQGFRILSSYVEGLSEGFRKAFTEAFAQALPNQEQEQEQYTTIPEQGPREAPAPPAGEAAPLPPALTGVGAPLSGGGTADSTAPTPDRPTEQPAHREQERALKVVPPTICFELAHQLVEAILRTKPNAKVPVKLDRWADTIRLMQDRDGRSVEQIAAVIARLPDDEFWRRQILSADNLRKHFDRLDMERQPALLPRTAAEKNADALRRYAERTFSR